MVARSPYGQVAVYPDVETVQRDGICVEVLAPAPGLAEERALAAQQLAIDLAQALGVVGLLAVELFETDAGLVVNELAMRPHNSGHWTIEGARTSQFEQHLRAVLDYPMGETSLTAPVVVMANVLGGPDGGPAPGGPPNSDIMFGGPDGDVNLWAPGDGSEAFVGGPGIDAIIFGSTDREALADPSTGVRLPTLLSGIPGFPQGIPTANVSGLANFCTLEPSPTSGYEFLVRFRGAAGNIIVTLRVSKVEQVFCTSQDGGSIAFANLTDPSPAFVAVSQQQVETLNPLVGAMIR